MDRAKRYLVKVIGAFDIIDREGRSVRPSGRKDCALLAILALTHNHRQTRTWLQEKLWGDRGPAQAAASLRQSIATLRSVLKNDVDVIYADRTWVWLDPAYLDFDYIRSGATGEILRGFDLREEGFNEWLRECRAVFSARETRWGSIEATQPDRFWYIDLPICPTGENRISEICDFIYDSLIESLSVIGLHAVINRRSDTTTPLPRATDLIVQIRALDMGKGCIVSSSVTDGFGSLKWQLRREINAGRWSDVRAVQIEMAQLLQDFAIRTEGRSLRNSRWSAYANGCQALMGVLVPGSMPLHDIMRCSEAAIVADEKGIYHALLGFSRLLLYGEREFHTCPDADEVMHSFRAALQLAPENGLVQALAGHAFGFLKRDLDRNLMMTQEAVRLLPGSGACWIFRAISLVYANRHAEAVRAADKAVLLCRGTLALPMARSSELFARLMAGDTAGAIRAGEMSLDTIVFRPTIVDLMTAYAREGRIEEGRAKLELLTAREPDLSVEMLRSPNYPIVNPVHRVAVVEAAARLGLG
ncbi:hypothetical protein [Paracoccus sp. AK26]|uniref:hypothetical protein n=1 Tax=Paracoccus sp. AK26 TaxID=2589076 RepID=UPI0014285598|nr:hypothetical protein [Paracoccus sp. AK26]QIR86488.1 hypothetical protein FIU66_14310 [Paracoccus sp. AK26]